MVTKHNHRIYSIQWRVNVFEDPRLHDNLGHGGWMGWPILLDKYNIFCNKVTLDK